MTRHAPLFRDPLRFAALNEGDAARNRAANVRRSGVVSGNWLGDRGKDGCCKQHSPALRTSPARIRHCGSAYEVMRVGARAGPAPAGLVREVYAESPLKATRVLLEQLAPARLQ